jgi:hypothetical protein
VSILPRQDRLSSKSVTFSELQPSEATVRSPQKRTPGVCGWASGPGHHLE